MNNLIFILITLSPSSVFAEIKSDPCSKDSDCVLYHNVCGELSAVLGSSVPSIQPGTKDDAKDENVKVCNRVYIIDPQRSVFKNPVPACVKKICVIIEGSKKSK